MLTAKLTIRVQLQRTIRLMSALPQVDDII